MDESRVIISNMRAITISREYGSGGGEIAARLAKSLGWQLIDHDVVVRVARRLGISEADAEEHDERIEGPLTRFLYSLRAIEPLIPNASRAPFETNANIYKEALNRVIKAVVNEGHVVIVGRGAQVVLANRRDILHVRIIAPMEQRIGYVMNREGLDYNAARSRVQLKDRDRMRYLQSEYQQNPTEPHLYDLVLNTAILDLDSAVDLVALALDRKAQHISTPTGQLGPVAGLSRYPNIPDDFHAPVHLSEKTSDDAS